MKSSAARAIAPTTSKPPHETRFWTGKISVRTCCIATPIAILVATVVIFISANWPYRYRKVEPMLEEVLASNVKIGHYHRVYFPNPGFMATDITLVRKSATGLPPLGTARSVMLQGTWLDLLMLRKRVRLVDITGLHIVIPTLGSPANHRDFPPGSSADFGGPTAVVEQLRIHESTLDIMRANGFTRDDILAWGGTFRFEGVSPDAGAPKFRAFLDGSLDTIFDEGADSWIGAALDAGMTVLSLAEPAVAQLEALGYRRAVIPQTRYPKLPSDILTVDFSGWPLFVRADLPDADVAQICSALAACVERIPWQEDAPLSLARMCRNAADAPYDVPLHPAAERCWKSPGVL